MRDENRSFVAAEYPSLPFAEGDWAAFQAALTRCGVTALTPDQRKVLEQMHGHLTGVNAWMNLTRIQDGAEYLDRHILDSLAPLADAFFAALPTDQPLVDLGTGGGYPGLPMTLLRPDLNWVLVDSRQRKVDFLVEALKVLPTHHSAALCLRVRDAQRAQPHLFRSCPLVVSRAAGPMDEVMAEARFILRPGGHLLLWKGLDMEADEVQKGRLAAQRYNYKEVRRLRWVLGSGMQRQGILLRLETSA
jgi:16S rRNA (guanine527-N7)-methyltransferase